MLVVNIILILILVLILILILMTILAQLSLGALLRNWFPRK